MIELRKPIPELSEKELNLHLGQVAILFDEQPTGHLGAEIRGDLRDLMDALQTEQHHRTGRPYS